MRALSATYYTEYARERIAEAQQAVEAHTTCAYTGVCLGCGRPSACDELLDAQRTLARYGRLPHRRPGASLTGPASQRLGGFAWFAGRPDLGPGDDRGVQMTTSANPAVDTAAGTLDPLRDACLAAQSATERAYAHLRGVAHPLPRLSVARCDSALESAWSALISVYCGLADARRLPGVDRVRVADVLDGLRAANADAARAADGASRVRRQLAVAEDRLRRADADPRACAVADRWRAAATRLDLVAARLAVATRAIDGSADALASGADQRGTRSVRLARLLPRARCPVDDLIAGTGVAGALLRAARPPGARRRFWTRVRHEVRREWRQ